jgi:hypothetical protein
LFEALRLFNCRECGQAVHVCRKCDKGRVYCTRRCAEAGRRRRVREAGRRYQSSRKGAACHAARQNKYRLDRLQPERSTPKNKVTQCDANEGPTDRCFNATEGDEGRPLDVGRQRQASNQAVRLGFKRPWS